MSFVLLPNLKITAHIVGSSDLFAGEADFSDSFEFAESWPNTLDTPDLSPTASFVTADLTEGFEFAESWPNTLDTPDLSPTASFVTADFDDGFEGSDDWPNAFPITYTETVITSSGDAIDGGTQDQYGYSVDITPDASIIVATSRYWDEPTTDAGSVTVLRNNGTNWYEEQVLTSSATPTGSWAFGQDLCIAPTGDKIFAGEYSYSGSSGGAGRVSIFVTGSGGWELAQEFTGSGEEFRAFNLGYRVETNQTGEKLFVGYPDYDIPGEATSEEGTVLIYASGSGGYAVEQTLTSSVLGTLWRFGQGVGNNANGDRLIIGSPRATAGGTATAGVVEFFRSGSGGWELEQLVSSSSPVAGDNLGTSAAMNEDGTRAAAGAGFYDAVVTNDGAVFVYSSGSGGWTEEQILTSSNTIADGQLGSTEIWMNPAGDMIVAGAPFSDNPTSQDGNILIFRSGSAGWYEEQLLTSSLATSGAGGLLGISFGVSSNGAVIAGGSPSSDTPTTNAGHISLFEGP